MFRLQVDRIYDSVDRGFAGVNNSTNTRINNLSGAYLSLSGGDLSGNLTVTDNVGIGTPNREYSLDASGSLRVGTTTSALIVDAKTQKVAIGRSVPESVLHVCGNVQSGLNAPGNLMTLVNTNPNSGSYAGILFQTTETSSDQRRALIVGGQDVGGGSAGYTGFHTRGGNFPESMRIDNAGNVGIGTTTPWRKLSVTGTVGFDG